MPKETFFNLNPQKREKILNAIKKEFGRVSFEEISIHRIVEEANIPRGSFYQYFENKEDAIKYILDIYLKGEQEKIDEILRKNKGDIFQTSFDIYDYMIKYYYINEDMILYRNIFEQLRKKDINFEEHSKKSHQEKLEKIKETIDLSEMRIETDQDLMDMLKLLSIVVRHTTIEIFSKRITKEEGKRQLERQILFLKKGMLK